MTVPTTLSLLISASVALALFGMLLTRLLAYTKRRHQENDDDGFSQERYEPMIALLAEEDLIFLAAQPGYRPHIGAKLRRERRRIFRLYLQDLAQYFHRLHAEARILVADSQKEHADLVGVLVRQQFTFWCAIFRIEARLLTHAGFGKVDVRGLVEGIEAMRLDLARLTLSEASAQI